MENVRIECPAKPIRHAFIHFKNDEERHKFVRSANMLKKSYEEGSLKLSRSMDADERFHQKEWVMSNEKHIILLDSITTNWTLKHKSVKGAKMEPPNIHQIPCGKNGNQKTHRNDSEQSRDRLEKKRRR